MTLAELAAAASELAARGIPVFPCAADKKPAIEHGFKSAVRDAAAARKLFLYTRTAALIGMPTGAVSGISVIDVDPQGMAWYAAKQRRLPETRVHQTRRGGYHLLYKHPPGLRNSASKISFGVDVRGDGGYIIIPPSPGYEVIHEVDIVDFPASILRQLNRKPTIHPKACVTRDSSTAALEHFVLKSRPGERNMRLFWAACRLGEAGQTASADALVQAALACGLDPIEAIRTVQSGTVRGATGGVRTA